VNAADKVHYIFFFNFSNVPSLIFLFVLLPKNFSISIYSFIVIFLTSNSWELPLYLLQSMKDTTKQ
jgi:hypothetical protein